VSDTATRTALAVALLSRDPDLLRLTLVWPQVEKGLSETARLVAWSRVAGLPLSVVRRKSVVLLTNRLCLPDGAVLEEAAKVCQSLAAAVLREAQRGRR
jgi:hypothetical protein